MWFGPNHAVNVSLSPRLEKITNNMMGIFAVKKALDILNSNDEKRCLILTDSNYAITVLSRDLACVKRRTIIKPNESLISEIREFISANNFDIKFELVKGHSTSRGKRNSYPW